MNNYLSLQHLRKAVESLLIKINEKFNFINNKVDTLDESLTDVAFSGNYNDLNNKPSIPTIPTNISAFNNDSGYLTYNETNQNYLAKTDLAPLNIFRAGQILGTTTLKARLDGQSNQPIGLVYIAPPVNSIGYNYVVLANYINYINIGSSQIKTTNSNGYPKVYDKTGAETTNKWLYANKYYYFYAPTTTSASERYVIFQELPFLTNEDIDLTNYALKTDIPENELFIATYGTTTYAEILAAYNANKIIVCKYTLNTGDLIVPFNYYVKPSAYVTAAFHFATVENSNSTRYLLSVNSSDSWSARNNIINALSSTNTTIEEGDRIVFTNTNGAYRLASNSSLAFGTATNQYLANNGTWQNIPINISTFTNDAGYLTEASISKSIYYCSTNSISSDSLKAVYIPGFVLTEGHILAVRFETANTSSGITFVIKETVQGETIASIAAYAKDSSYLKFSQGTIAYFLYTSNVYRYITDSHQIVHTQGSDIDGYLTFSSNNASGLRFHSNNSDIADYTTLSSTSISDGMGGRMSALAISGVVTCPTPANSNQIVNKNYVDTAISNINGFEVAVVNSLPTENIDTHTFYFMSNSGSGNNIYDEYLYINNAWEKIGSTEIDLSGYLLSTDIADWAKASTKPSYTANEVGALSSDAPAAAITSTDITNWNAKPSIDELVKQVPLNGSGGTKGLLFAYDNNNTETTNTVYKTSRLTYNENGTDPELRISRANGQRYAVLTPISLNIPSVNTGYMGILQMSTLSQARVYSFPDATGTIALTSDIPTSLSDLTNDSGFITSSDIPVTSVNGQTGAVTITDSDEKLKTITLSNSSTQYYPLVGEANQTASTKYYSTNFRVREWNNNFELQIGQNSSNPTSGSIKLVSNQANAWVTLKTQATTDRVILFPDAAGTIALTSDIPTVPTNVSAFINDAGYLTSYTETDPTVPAWAKAATKPTYTASEVGAVPSEVQTGGGSQYGQIYNSASSGISLVHGNAAGSSQIKLLGRELTLISTKGQGNSSIVLKTNNTNVITLSEGQATIIGVVTPTTNDMAANKGYVDSAIGALTIPTRYNASTNITGYLTMADLPVYNGGVA